MGSTGGSTSADNVTIHWKGHADILAKGLAGFFREQYLVDTDVSIRGETLKTHKMILALFLPTFKKSVDDVNGQLHGLNLDYVANGTEDVRALIEFVYTGTVSVAKDRLGHLGRLADCLQFEGLSKAIVQLCDVNNGAPVVEQGVDPNVLEPDVGIKEEPNDEIDDEAQGIDNSMEDMRVGLSEEPCSTGAPSSLLDQSMTLKISHVQGATVVSHMCYLCGTNYDSADSHTSHHLKHHVETNKSYRCTACVTELRKFDCSESLSKDSFGRLIKYVAGTSVNSGSGGARGGGGQQDEVSVQNPGTGSPDNNSPPKRSTTSSSVGKKSILKAFFRKVKPDPDTPKLNAEREPVVEEKEEEKEKAPIVKSANAMPKKTSSSPNLDDDDIMAREYGCAFCKTFNTRDRAVWIEHLAQAHGLIRPSDGDDNQQDRRPATSTAAGQAPAPLVVERLEKIIAGGSQFTCTTCTFRFTSSSRLDRHVRWMHPRMANRPTMKRKRSGTDLAED